MSNETNQMNNKPENGTTGKQSYAAEQQAKRDKCYEMSNTAATEVVSSIENFRRYLDIQSRFDKYSTNNNLLIYAQNPDATVMKTYAEWQEENKQVKKGATAVMILEPKEGKNANGETHTYYNPKSKFDVTALTEPPETTRVSYDDRLLVQALVNRCPFKVETPADFPKDNYDGAFYDAKRNCIVARAGMKASDIFTSVSVALAHAEIAKAEKENVEPGEVVPEYRCAAHEFQARCAGYILAQKYEVPTDKVAIRSIPQRFSEYKPEDIKHELSEINRCVKNITERMKEKLEPEKHQEKKRDDRDAR